MSTAQDGLIYAIGWAHVLLAPYTKVEESFNLHATHDVLMYGVQSPNLHNYDHFTFPGAVPRTFIGSVLLAWLSTSIIQLANWRRVLTGKANMQIIIRLVLAGANATALCFLRRAVSRRFGRLTGLFFTLFTCSQFHVPFWMGRTLPNMFALIPVNFATSLLVDRAPNATRPSKHSVEMAIALLTFTTVIFRAEVLLLLGPLVLQCLISRNITILNVIKIGALSGIASIVLTISVDSYFWNTFPIWPEFSGLYFNVYEGKSSEWGVSPPLAYFVTHLPKLCLSSLPLALVGITIDQRIRSLIFPSLLFLGLISCLGHKEWRFIVYIVPIFNVAAARAARWMVSRRKNSLFGRFLFLIVAGLLACNVLVTCLLTYASIHNYPGGEALALFHRLYPSTQTQPPLHVHISNLAAQTGASLFLQVNSSPHPPPSLFVSRPQMSEWKYDKTESLTLRNLTATHSITHLISETKPGTRMGADWKTVGSIDGFERWAIDWELIKARGKGASLDRLRNVLTMVTEKKLWILERRRL
ncbi:Alg9-like mannosyltransferase family-domain-containing protein [Collybia nuda]|uniref:Mannosyltransferase n=1 Tax=Collybia nuda TaxID=64659 RepID=A0A9P6CFH2_9AGAR|nr:Alg9-like mannosyltransferase family-domain-containing protein [Collybia nuda]